MDKIAVFIFSFLLMNCSSLIEKSSNPDDYYFADAAECFHYAGTKTSVKIPMRGQEGFNLNTVTVIDIPLGNNANKFKSCMEHKGHPIATKEINADDYLNKSKACLSKAKQSSMPNQTYAKCTEQSIISVEPINTGQDK